MASDPLSIPLTQLRERTSFKWRTYPDDVLPLWVAEMDCEPAAPITEAVARAMSSGDTGYPTGTAYAEALRDFASERWGWDGLVVERSALVPDVMVGITDLVRVLTDPGGSVVVTAPVYPPFYSFPEYAERVIVEAMLGTDRRLDLAAIDDAFARATATGPAVMLLSNPHNPTGVAHTRAELEGLAELAHRHGVTVISDEIHAPLVLPGATFTPYLSVDPAGLAVMSASKSWNLAGLKAAVVCAGPAAADVLPRIPEVVGHGVSHLGVIAHTAALREGGPWLDSLLASLTVRRDLLGELLAEHLPSVGYVAPEATYLAWLDCRPLHLHEAGPAPDASRGNVLSLDGPAAFFAEHAKVALNSGPAFGSGGEGHVRMNFATSREVLTEALQRMGSAVVAAGGTP